ncbi:MAG: Gx transporter family protein [Ruminococcus sp.]|nr:Gx transporter family protein [Ruminococcus sp.]MDE6425480.1 Gx transporter family protein [Ruminococcus sp.]
MKIRKLTELSMLTAIALIIFIIELRIPSLSAVQGVKLGLANIITVYAIYRYKLSETAMIVFTRVILGAVFSGNISAIMYSASGAFFCLLGMSLLKRIINEDYLWLCSIAGAIFHNIGQIIVAVCVTKTFTVISYLPVMIVSGCIAGFFTGMCVQYIYKRVLYSYKSYFKL